MSGSYARGGQPRSAPDPDAAAYDAAAYEEMIRRQRALNAKHDQPETYNEDDYWGSHPGVLESMVPVWGSAREAIADAKEGDVGGAVVNGVLAVTDLAPGAALLKTAGKGALKGAAKMAGSHSWGATRSWMGRRGLIEKGMEGHHALIPNGGWGKKVPEAFKNQPWNITALPKETHRRIHTAYGRQPRYGVVERTWVGTPTWGKATIGLIPNRVITGADAASER
jgi:hypothetical protein